MHEKIVPMGATLRVSDLLRRGAPNALDHAIHARYFLSGRLSLFALLKLLVDDTDRREVLLPAYHCTSLVEPCEWAGLDIQFYKVHPDLQPDLQDITAKLSDSTLAALFIHYFGIPNEIAKAAQLCRKNDVVVIEDACHIDVTDSRAAASAGKHGDWVLASIRKFYPIYDGGCFYAAQASSGLFSIEQPRASLGDELRSIKHALASLCKGTVKPSLGSELMGNHATPTSTTERIGRTGKAQAPYLDRRFTVSPRTGMTLTSRHVLRRLASRSTLPLRRVIYDTLLRYSSKLSRCRPMFQELPSNVFPYVFPVYLEFPDEDHRALRTKGIEVYRWEDLYASDCNVSKELEKHLVQLPCHQDLTSSQLRYLTSVLEYQLR